MVINGFTSRNFSKPAAPVFAQMFNFLNLGFEGYKKIAYKDLRNARLLSQALEKTYFTVTYPRTICSQSSKIICLKNRFLAIYTVQELPTRMSHMISIIQSIMKLAYLLSPLGKILKEFSSFYLKESPRFSDQYVKENPQAKQVWIQVCVYLLDCGFRFRDVCVDNAQNKRLDCP